MKKILALLLIGSFTMPVFATNQQHVQLIGSNETRTFKPITVRSLGDSRESNTETTISFPEDIKPSSNRTVQSLSDLQESSPRTPVSNNDEFNFTKTRDQALEGDLNAQSTLGVEYYLGQTIEQDYFMAHYWLSKAAERGDFFSQYVLASIYEHGLTGDQSKAKALYWYEKSANPPVSG